MKEHTITGRIKTIRKAIGFIEDPKDPENDIAIEADHLNFALNGDTVEAVIIKKSKDEKLGKVIRIVERARTTFVGTVEERNGKYGVIPDDKKVYIDFLLSPSESAKVKSGDKVQVQLGEWTDALKNPTGIILRVIGQKGNNNAEMESIVLEKGFEYHYPKEVEGEAHLIEQNKQKILDAEIPKRRDIRKTLTFTIDPVDAKDFDDAISFVDNGDGTYEIGVHIADVSHYVTEGSALDKEALKRGTSIYLVDRTIPMLPEVLSNDVCSLNPHEDKLTFSAIFTMNDKAEIRERWFGRTIMNSDYRFTYETAQESIDSGTGPFAKELRKLNEVAKILQREKFNAGAIEFETEEIKFTLDENGKPIGVYKKERLDTHKLVEEYMLLANREVAKFIYDSIGKKGKRDTGSIYRIHDLPDKDRMIDLSTFVKALGYTLKNKEGKVSAHDLKSLLKEIKGTPHETMISTALIRSMQKAVYSTKNIGHFGLAFEYYTHFTSPIRRYPDLLVHRILDRHLKHQPFGDREIVEFQNIAERSTAREIDAAEAERASKKLKQVEYMSDKIGLVFNGIISGVTEWGLYIEDVETKSEGMIKTKDLGTDFYIFDKKTYSIIGQKTGERFQLGDKIKFKVAAADLDRRTLDFTLVRE